MYCIGWEAIVVWEVVVGYWSSSLSRHLSPSLNSWTQYIAFN